MHYSCTWRVHVKHAGLSDVEREVRPFDPPPPSCDLLGGQPPPSPPAPRAYAPLAGPGCSAPPKPWALCAAACAANLSASALASSIAFWKALVKKKSANKCRWQRRRDRPRPSRPLCVRRWQAAIALLSALAQSHDPPHSSSNRIFAPRCQPHGTPLTCCTDMLPHTPTPTNTPLGDGTSLNWMPLRAASA